MSRLFESCEQLNRDPLRDVITPLQGLLYALLSAFFLGVQTMAIAANLKSHRYEFAMMDFVGLWALLALQLLRYGRMSWRRLAASNPRTGEPTH
jgi:hypothetical protein